MLESIPNYLQDLKNAINFIPDSNFLNLFVNTIIERKKTNSLYIIGNGGSAGNAIHIANDFIYGATAGTNEKKGIRVNSLTSNQAVITCLGNDIGYENIFVEQLKTLAIKNDILLSLSGSGNSKNILNAVEYANMNGITTFSITGYDGGMLKKISKYNLHIPINDMQVAEDIQLIFGHCCMKAINLFFKQTNT